MSYYEEYDEDYESVEEIQEMIGEQSTEVRKSKNKLVIEFDTTNFAKGIVQEVRQEVVSSLRDEVLAEIKREVLEDGFKEKIHNAAHSIVKEMIDDYVENEKITIGGNSFWGDESLQEFTMQEYAKKCIADSIKEGRFYIVTGYRKGRYSDSYEAERSSLTYADYIRSKLAIGNDIKEYIDEQIIEIKNNVNTNVKELFDSSTKKMLSESVLNILMANDTYKKIESGIACIADNVQNRQEDDEWN